MKIQVTKNDALITPQELLRKFEQGERPIYKYNNDELQKELDILAQKYKNNLSLDTKIELLAKERDILYQELEHPELVLARNYQKISEVIPKEIKGSEVKDILRLFSITGINRNEGLKGVYAHKSSESRINSLEKAYLNLSEKTNAGLRGKSYIITTLSKLERQNLNFKEKITSIFNNLLQNTENEELKKSILSATSNFDKDKVLKNLKTNPNQAKLFEILLSKTKHNDKEVAEFITNILNSKDIEPDIYRTAVWGAGRYKNDANFEIIKNITLNKNESDIRKREFAIQSTALYLKNKPNEVREIISSIKNEETIFKTLGKILNDKINGNYHGQKNRELNYLNYDKKQIEEFRQICNNFFETEKPLNLQQENACYRAILYFKNILGQLVNDGYKYILQHDTFTKQASNFAGQRYINSRAGIYNSGDFYDAFDGIKTDNYNMMNYYRVMNSNHTNVMAHETAHTLNEFFTKKDLQELDKLYKQAEKNNLFLDRYAAGNSREYFAQGCMAFATHYLPHNTLLNSFDHTRFELITKDPELYKFVKKVIKKYH